MKGKFNGYGQELIIFREASPNIINSCYVYIRSFQLKAGEEHVALFIAIGRKIDYLIRNPESFSTQLAIMCSE